MALSSNCWKYLVLTFNVLFAMSAVVLFGASGYLLYKLFIYRHFLGVGVQYPVIVLLVMSIISCSVAWIGWRTARSMFQLHVIAAGVLVSLVVVVEFSCFVWALVVWDAVEVDVGSNMNQYFAATAAGKDPASADSVRWDRLQVKFECCGVSGPGDYRQSSSVPFSCCGQGPLSAPQQPYAADCGALYQRGCGARLHQYVAQHLLYVAFTALTAALLQSPGVFCTFCLADAILKRRRTSVRNSTSIRESTFAAPDDSLLSSPTAPAPTLPKY